MQSDKEGKQKKKKERVNAVLLLCLPQCKIIDPANLIASKTHLFQVELTQLGIMFNFAVYLITS